MLNLRKKQKKNLRNNTFSTSYYLYIKNKYFLNCAFYQKPFFFFDFLLLLNNYKEVLKFKPLRSSQNLNKLYLRRIIINTLYLILCFTKSNKFYKRYRKILLKNLIKLLKLNINIQNYRKTYIFNKRWT